MWFFVYWRYYLKEKFNGGWKGEFGMSWWMEKKIKIFFLKFLKKINESMIKRKREKKYYCIIYWKINLILYKVEVKFEYFYEDIFFVIVVLNIVKRIF